MGNGHFKWFENFINHFIQLVNILFWILLTHMLFWLFVGLLYNMTFNVCCPPFSKICQTKTLVLLFPTESRNINLWLRKNYICWKNCFCKNCAFNYARRSGQLHRHCQAYSSCQGCWPLAKAFVVMNYWASCWFQ